MRRMKNYLDLVHISAKVRRRQSRLTRLCIALSVFLVSCIFGMADMQIRTLYAQGIQTDGAPTIRLPSSWPGRKSGLPAGMR